MAKPRPRKTSNPDLRRRSHVPAPQNAEIETTLWQWLQPQHFLPLKETEGRSGERLRSRILTLPVMVAVVLSLVYRQMPSLAEVIRHLKLQGLLWVEPTTVSLTALSKRMRKLPASLFVELWDTVQERFEQQQAPTLSDEWQALSERFRCIWIADGSTLEALRQRLKIRCAATESRLAGRMMMIVEMMTLRPVQMQYEINPHSNDKIHCDWLLSQLPEGGLLVFDLGFFKFAFFDAFTDSKRFFVTRLREKTAYKTKRVLAYGERYRDEIIAMGQHHTNPCEHPVRRVSVLWNQTWYHYLTNVLDPQILSTAQVCDLYRRRWRIEDAFCLTKRLLGLAYLWVEDSNGVEIQIVATWIFYAVLNDLCTQVASALRQPLETISLEMVFRGLYHYSQARLDNASVELIPFFVEHHKLLGLVKAKRKRHRLRDAQWADIWREIESANPC